MKTTTRELLTMQDFEDKIKNRDKKLESYTKNKKLHHSVIKTILSDLKQYYTVVQYQKGNRGIKPYWIIGEPKPYEKKKIIRGSIKE